MGIKRIVDTAFWTDGKVDEFTPEDKYFMLYLLTNPFTTQLGIYEISIKQVAFQLGYSMESVRNLIDRFQNKYDVVFFSKETNEIAIKNFLRHSIVKGGHPVRDCLRKEMKQVKDKSLLDSVFKHISQFDNLNKTVIDIIKEFNPNLFNENENEKENENDNENDNENENENEDTSTYRERIVTCTKDNDKQGYDFGENKQTDKDGAENSVDNSVENLLKDFMNKDSEKYFEVAKFRGNVWLSDAQIDKLLKEMGILDFEKYVDRLDSFIERTKANIKDHSEIIRKWYNEDKK